MYNLAGKTGRRRRFLKSHFHITEYVLAPFANTTTAFTKINGGGGRCNKSKKYHQTSSLDFKDNFCITVILCVSCGSVIGLR